MARSDARDASIARANAEDDASDALAATRRDVAAREGADAGDDERVIGRALTGLLSSDDDDDARGPTAAAMAAMERDMRALAGGATVGWRRHGESIGRAAARAAGRLRRGAAATERDEGRAEAMRRCWSAFVEFVVRWGMSSEVWGVGARSGVCEALTRLACRRDDEGDGEDGEGTSYKPPHARESDENIEMCEKDACDLRAGACGALGALARLNGKALHGAWATMLPTSEHQLREKSVSTSLVKVIACDSSAKVRGAAANATMALFEGPASRQYLAIAERREAATSAGANGAASSSLAPGFGARVRSFSALSTTLGDMVIITLRALLTALSREKNAQCARELCKAVAALCDAAPFDRFPRDLLRETVDSIHAKLVHLSAETPSDRSTIQSALFGALASALSARGATRALDEYLSSDSSSSMIYRMISHAKGEVAGSRCEAFSVLRALVVHHTGAATLIGDELRELFPSAVCASGADDRVCQASARLLTDYLGSVSGSGQVRDDDEVDFGMIASTPALPSEVLRAAWTNAIESQLPTCALHKSALTRVAGLNVLTRVNSNVLTCFGSDVRTLDSLLSMPHSVLSGSHESVPAVRAAACRALGFLIYLPCVNLEETAAALLIAAEDVSKSVKIPAMWSLANLCAVNATRENRLCDDTVASLAKVLIASAAEQGDKVRASATRGIGHLIAASTFDTSHEWLHKAAQSLTSCLTTGNAKTQWNACLGVAALLQNDSAMDVGAYWADFIVRMLLLLVRDAKNFKIRLHAAAALAVGARHERLTLAYVDSVSVLTLSLEALEIQSTAFESQSAMDFKYKPALICQLTTTLVSVLAVARVDGAIGDALKKSHAITLSTYQSLRDYLDGGNSDARVVASFKTAVPLVNKAIFDTSLNNIVASLLATQPSLSARALADAFGALAFSFSHP